MPVIVPSAGNPVTVADIEARWRPLTPEETTIAETRLTGAWARIKRRLPTIEDRIAAGTLDVDLVVDVVCDVVLRVLKNPDGFRSEQSGDYMYSLERGASSGRLEPLPSEWRMLSGRGQVTSVSLNDTALPDVMQAPRLVDQDWS